MIRADLNLLRSLSILIEEGNVTRAAARLGISQPALSAQLVRLRDLFGDPLLVPSETGRGMLPTPRALELRLPLEGVLSDVEALLARAPAFDPRRADRRFTIAASDNGTTVLGLELLADLARQGIEGIKLAFVPLNARSLRADVEAGEIDLVIAHLDDVPAGLRTRAVLDDRQHLVQRRDHPRGTGPVTLADYCRWRHVLVTTEGRMRTAVDDHIEAQGYRRDIALTVPQYILAVLAVAQSDMFALVPARLAERFTDRVDGFDIPFRPSGFSLQLAWHSRNQTDGGHQWLRDRIVEIAARRQNA
ncbi:LysR family transcriptional regulator [uncultured Maritimibacter sp.]|jgi:DNA-binding transcriptional LysR family regulator|uniref:LysR family transcriptional regulator n=1 Tax=uncultured Maritimibacter sp. TaxID=991866 RepID=UPI000AED8624|nr:LysR family transcriptional regulator [uncultured Maritimibacter sp.]